MHCGSSGLLLTFSLPFLIVLLLSAGVFITSAELPSLVQLKVDSRARITAGVGHNMTIEVQFFTTSKDTIKDAYVTFYGGDYFITQMSRLPDFDQETPFTKSFTLSPKSENLNHLDVPENITITVEDAEGTQLGSTVVAFKFSEFIGNLRQYKSRRAGGRNRVLLVGIQGAGKSTFINSVYALATNKPSSQAALAGFGTISTTTVVRQFDPPNLPLTLIDTWGLNETNLDDYPIDLLLDGNYEYLSMDTNRTVAPSLRLHKPDAVLFFVDGEATDAALDAIVMKAWSRIARQVQLHSKIKLHIVITKIDNENPMLRRDPTLSLQQEAQAVTKLLVERGVIPNMITYTLLYHKQEDLFRPNWQIDRSIYALLDHVLSAITSANPVELPPVAQCVTMWRTLPSVAIDLFFRSPGSLPASLAQLNNYYAIVAVVIVYVIAALFTYLIMQISTFVSAANAAAPPAVPDPHGRAPALPPAPKPVSILMRLVMAIPGFVGFMFLVSYASDMLLHEICDRTLF